MYQTVKVFDYPHDVCVDDEENLYVAQWNSGNVYPYKFHRYDKKNIAAGFSFKYPIIVFSQALFQLAPPMLKYKSGFFSGSTSFEITFNQPGADSSLYVKW